MEELHLLWSSVLQLFSELYNLNMARLTNRSIGNTIGYNESSKSRVVASSGAHTGMAIIHEQILPKGTIINKNFTSGPFNGCGFTVTLTNMAGVPVTYACDSVGRCTTFAKKLSGTPFILSDTVR